MIKIIVVLFIFSNSNTGNKPPAIHCAPPSAIPYVKMLRYEPRFVQWWIKTQSEQPLTDYYNDTTEPAKERQRAWHVRNKFRR